MKILIVAFSVLAVTSAAYYGPQHYPVIGPNGVPVEPVEVQAARANHLAALSSAHGGASFYSAPVAPYTAVGVPALGHNALPLDTPEVAAAKVQHYHDFAVAAQRNGVHVPIAAPLISGYPVDTPEVQLAKAAHFAAHAEAARAGPGSYLGHYRRRRDVYGGYHIPVIGPNGVPVEPPAVQAARARHLAALSEANVRGSAAPHGYTAAAYSSPSEHRYYGPYAEIGPDGQPQETQAVRAAKAHHFAAYSAALSGNLGYGHY
ncbi:cuticle protein 18.7-like [Cylas formicarius]|uniref:cuticle protein 18.7-like n=1 Tax=Cylas formicarius TaxID=197179 RepID=UPI0029584CFE|nr:cuticle protein 18.7-like [Cylas formicarius]